MMSYSIRTKEKYMISTDSKVLKEEQADKEWMTFSVCLWVVEEEDNNNSEKLALSL